MLITGGGSGIGAALTEGFVRQGAKVAFIDIAEEPSRALADRLEKETGTRPLFLKADLRDIEALRAAVAEAAEAHGDVTVLVNNAALDERHEIDGRDRRILGQQPGDQSAGRISSPRRRWRPA